jgi:hypothetical protein
MTVVAVLFYEGVIEGYLRFIYALVFAFSLKVSFSVYYLIGLSGFVGDGSLKSGTLSLFLISVFILSLIVPD